MKPQIIVILIAALASFSGLSTGQTTAVKRAAPEIRSFVPGDVKHVTISAVEGALRIVIGNDVYLYRPKQTDVSTNAADVSACCAVHEQLRKCSKFIITCRQQTSEQRAAYTPISVDEIVIEFAGLK